MERKKKVCYVLAYRCPNYVRTRVILEALTRIDGLSLLKALNTATGLRRYFQTLTKLIRLRMTEKPDYYILGLRGTEIFWPVRIITAGKPLIFDQMMSSYDSLVNERQTGLKSTFLDKMLRSYEKSILRHADIVLTDTLLHRDYFSQLFDMPRDKIVPIPVSADESVFFPVPAQTSPSTGQRFHVLFYGSLLPLHGVEFILAAAQNLSDHPVTFTLIGGERKGVRRIEETKKRLRLTNVIHEKWVDFERLPEWIGKADLCLGGPFGGTGQARRVITGKTFQFLAMNKPTLVGNIACDHGFVDKFNCLLIPQADAKAITQAILWAMENRDKLTEIGVSGGELYRQRYSNDRVREAFIGILDTLAERANKQ